MPKTCPWSFHDDVVVGTGAPAFLAGQGRRHNLTETLRGYPDGLHHLAVQAHSAHLDRRALYHSFFSLSEGAEAKSVLRGNGSLSKSQKAAYKDVVNKAVSVPVVSFGSEADEMVATDTDNKEWLKQMDGDDVGIDTPSAKCLDKMVSGSNTSLAEELFNETKKTKPLLLKPNLVQVKGLFGGVEALKLPPKPERIEESKEGEEINWYSNSDEKKCTYFINEELPWNKKNGSFKELNQFHTLEALKYLDQFDSHCIPSKPEEFLKIQEELNKFRPFLENLNAFLEKLAIWKNDYADKQRWQSLAQNVSACDVLKHLQKPAEDLSTDAAKELLIKYKKWICNVKEDDSNACKVGLGTPYNS